MEGGLVVEVRLGAIPGVQEGCMVEYTLREVEFLI